MRTFIIFLFLSFFGCITLSRAMEVNLDLETPRATEFDSEASWSDMHNYAQGRAEWFRETMKALRDGTRDLKDRVTLAKKIEPHLDESGFPVSKGLKKETQIKLQRTKLVESVTSDIVYSFLYWDFLERTLEFYNSTPNNIPEIRNALLPHLARELTNFDLYAIDDLKENTQSRYFSEEFFINRAIYQECAALAGHYEIEISQFMQFYDETTKEPVALNMASDLTGTKIKSSQESSKASKKEAYFMEQLIYFRRTNTSNDPIPNLDNPMFKAMQTYILPSTGPFIIQPILIEAKVEPSKTISSKPQAPQKKPMKTKSTKKTKKSKAPKQSPLPIKPSKALTDVSSVPDSNEVIKPEEITLPKVDQRVVSSLKTITTETVQTHPSISPIQSMPVISFTPRRLNLRDVTFQIQYRNSTDYSFHGQIYKFPFSAQSPACFSINFLTQIKEMTHLSPKTDKLPNLAQGAITFHYETGVHNGSKTIRLGELFLSGGKFFGKSDLNFKDEHKIVNAMQDMLTREEREAIHSLPMGKKGIPLGIALEKHLRRHIIEGPWKNNCVDSEAILLLKLLQKLPNILKYQLMNGSDQPVTLKHAVLSISSYRDCCPNCQKLIQGFQWQLRNLILGFNISNLIIDDDFGTLAIVKGHVRPTGNYPEERFAISKGPVSLKSVCHTLVCTQSH